MCYVTFNIWPLAKYAPGTNHMFPVILTIPIYQIRFEEIDAFKSGLKCVEDCCYWINK